MLVYVVLSVFVLVIDWVAYFIWRHRRYEHARRTAEYPLTDPTNWRQPSTFAR